LTDPFDADATRQGLASEFVHRIECEMAAAGYCQAQLTASLSGIPLYRRLGWRSREAVTIALPSGSSLLCLRMTKDLQRAATRAA
jgi:hypothetical protein